MIGVLASKGQTALGQDQDDLVMIPFTTAERKVLGVAAPSQAQTRATGLSVAANPFGMQPRLTGNVNSIYVQARGVDQRAGRDRSGHRPPASAGTTSSRAA